MSKGGSVSRRESMLRRSPHMGFSQKVIKNPPQKTVPMERASEELQNAVSNAEIRPFFAENESFQVRLVVRQ